MTIEEVRAVEREKKRDSVLQDQIKIEVLKSLKEIGAINMMEYAEELKRIGKKYGLKLDTFRR